MKKRNVTIAIATGMALTGFTAITANADEVVTPSETKATTVASKTSEVTQAEVTTTETYANQAQRDVDAQQTVVNEATRNVEKTSNAEKEAKANLDVATANANEATPKNIQSAKEKVEAVKAEIKANETKVVEQQANVNEATTKVTNQNDKVVTAQKEVDNAQKEVDNAKTDVEKAQSILDGTGAKEVISKAEQTQAKVNADKEVVAKAQTKLDEAKKADETRSKAITEAKKDLAVKETIANKADKTLTDASKIAEQAKNTLADKKVEFSKAEADFKATNTIVVPAKYIEALKAYKNYEDLSEEGDKKRAEAGQQLKAMNNEMASLNKFNSNSNDNGITLTLGSLTDEQKMELTFFANDLLNQIREAFGTNKVVVSKGAMKFADEVADRYVADNWDWDKVISEGHDEAGIEELAGKNGLFEGQFYENMYSEYGSRSTMTMNRAKELVFEAFVSFLYNGQEWEHAGSVSGVTSTEDKNQFMGIALSSRKDVTGFHLINVVERLVREGSSFDTTAIVNPNTKEAIEARYNNAKTALENATTAYNNAQTDLVNAQNSKKQADTALSVAKKVLAEKEAVKVQTPEAQSTLDKAQENLVKSTADNEKAQKAVAELNADIQAKQAKLAQAKAVLSTKQEVLNAKQTILKAEQAKLAQAKADLATAKADLETAKAELKGSERTLVEAQEKVQNLENAPAKLVEAQNALAKAQNALVEAQKNLEAEQIKLNELIVKRDEAKKAYEVIKAQFDKQEEAKKQAELERKREELAKQGIQNVPVVSQTGKVIGFVQSKNRYKYGAVVSPQIVPYNSENNFEKTNQNSERQLPSTGQFDSVFSMIGALLIGTFGFGLITKRKEN